MTKTKKASVMAVAAAVEEATVGDTLNITVEVENTGTDALEGGKLTLDHGEVSAGDGYSESSGTFATITKIESKQKATVKASYTVADGDASGLTIKATFVCGEVNVSGTAGPITVTKAEEKKSEVVATVKTEGSYLGVNYADLGTFQIDGLKITGQAKQATAQGWNGEGQDQTGYFIGLHFDNCKLLKTAKHPDGKPPDETGDWLLLLGEESPTLSWFKVEDNSGKEDEYTVSVTAAS